MDQWPQPPQKRFRPSVLTGVVRPHQPHRRYQLGAARVPDRRPRAASKGGMLVAGCLLAIEGLVTVRSSVGKLGIRKLAGCGQGSQKPIPRSYLAGRDLATQIGRLGSSSPEMAMRDPEGSEITRRRRQSSPETAMVDARCRAAWCDSPRHFRRGWPAAVIAISGEAVPAQHRQERRCCSSVCRAQKSRARGPALMM